MALLLFHIVVFSQVDKMGYTRSDVINSMQGQPCKNSSSTIWYCGENGSFINYEFENDIVVHIFYMWEFRTKYLADVDVKSEIEKNSRVYGRPTMKGEEATWFVGDNLIMIKYGLSNGKHYSTYGIRKWR